MTGALVVDIGGGSSGFGKVVKVRRFQIAEHDKSRVKFPSKDALVRDIVELIAGKIEPEQTIVPISVAGPVSPDHRVIIKLTNQTGVKIDNIELAHEVETEVSTRLGRQIKVVLLNDGDAAGFAEFSEGGALSELASGQLGMALIVGNGVGGRLYVKRTGLLIESVPAMFEPGHRLIGWHQVKEAGIGRLFADRSMDCSCGIVGRFHLGESACSEPILNGPGIGETVKRAVAEDVLAKEQDCGERIPVLRAFPSLARFVKQDITIRRFELYRQIRANTDFSTVDVVAALQDTGPASELCRQVLRGTGRLFAGHLLGLQANQSEQVTFALVGGAGIGLGPTLVPYIREEIRELIAHKQVSDWTPQPSLAVGAFPSDVTNLIGAAAFMEQYQRGA